MTKFLCDLGVWSYLEDETNDWRMQTRKDLHPAGILSGIPPQKRRAPWISSSSLMLWVIHTLPVEMVGRNVWIKGKRRSPGEGNDSSLYYSCLENTRNRGAWQARVYVYKMITASDVYWAFFISLNFYSNTDKRLLHLFTWWKVLLTNVRKISIH